MNWDCPEAQQVADLICNEIDFGEMQDLLLLDLLIEDKETVEEILKGKNFPVNKPQLELILDELKQEGVLNTDFEAPEKTFSKEEVITVIQSLAQQKKDKIK